MLKDRTVMQRKQNPFLLLVTMSKVISPIRELTAEGTTDASVMSGMSASVQPNYRIDYWEH